MKPKFIIEEFIRTDNKISDFATKFGGRPVWMNEPQWPVSRGWNERPMMFIGQIFLDKKIFNNSESHMAYIFATHPQNPNDDFFDPDVIYPDQGENAVILQPSCQALVHTKKLSLGPTMFAHDGSLYEAYPKTKYSVDPDFIDQNTLRNLSEIERKNYCDSIDGNKIGGTPYFFQSDEWPNENEWILLLQLNTNFQPFYLNLGALPTAFVFISKDFKIGKLLIQDM